MRQLWRGEGGSKESLLYGFIKDRKIINFKGYKIKISDLKFLLDYIPIYFKK